MSVDHSPVPVLQGIEPIFLSVKAGMTEKEMAALLQLSINFRPLKAIRSNHFFDFTFTNTS